MRSLPVRSARRRFFVLNRLPPVSQDDRRAPSGLSFVRLTSEDIGGSALFRVRGRERKFHNRDGRTHSCFGFVDADGDPLSFAWLTVPSGTSTPVPLGSGVSLLLSPGSAYVWDCVTRKDMRGRGLYTETLRRLASRALSSGCYDVWICADEDNVASRRGIERAGFRPAFAVNLYRLGPVRLVRWRSRARLFVGAGAADILPPSSGSVRSAHCQGDHGASR